MSKLPKIQPQAQNQPNPQPHPSPSPTPDPASPQPDPAPHGWTEYVADLQDRVEALETKVSEKNEDAEETEIAIREIFKALKKIARALDARILPAGEYYGIRFE